MGANHRDQAYLEFAAPTPLVIDTVPNGNWSTKCERDTYFTSEAWNGECEKLAPETCGNSGITLFQRLIAALIPDVDSEDICCSGNEDLSYGSGLELDAEFEGDSLNYRSSGNIQIDGHAALNGYRICASGRPLDKQGHVELENNIEDLINSGSITNFDHSKNGIFVGQEPAAGLACTEFQYDTMSLDNRLLLEMQNVGVFLDAMPGMAFSECEEITEDIRRLEDMHQWQASKKKSLLGELLKFGKAKRKLQERGLDQRAIDKLVEMTYEKYMTLWGPNASGGKSSSTKIAKKASLVFVKRTVERCQKFEDSGKSCFIETAYKDMLLSGFSRPNEFHPEDTTTEGESSKLRANTASCALEARVSASISSQQSPSLTSRFGQNMDIYSSDLASPLNYSMDQNSCRKDTWSNLSEVLLNDVVGTLSTSGVGNSIPINTKGKRSERDRDGKGQSREVSKTKISWQSLSNAKEERKSKAKLKQKTTQLSASINGFLGKMSEQPNTVLQSVLKSSEMVTSRNSKGRDRFRLDTLDDSEAIDLSHLQLPGMDVLGVHNDLDDQGEDLDSWLNIDDDVLQDDDFMGLEIPMDDLSELNMIV